MRKTRAYAIMIILICALMAVSGCGAKETGKDTAPEPTVDPYEGFITGGEAQSGGSIYPSANAKSLSFGRSENDTVLTLEFAGGSRLSGDAQETAANAVPRYTISMLEYPYRLVIDFPSLSYCDFTRTFDCSAYPLVYGCVKHCFSTDDSHVTVYIQLTERTAYTVTEQGGALIVKLRPMLGARTEAVAADAVTDVTGSQATAGEGFYVLANQYRAYCTGDIPADIGMTPVLAADGTTVFLISQKFGSSGEAERFMADALKKAENAVASDWRVTQLRDNRPPAYDESMEYEAAHEIENARKDGEPVKLSVLIEDGFFLTVTPEKDGYVYSKRVVTGVGNDQYEYEQLRVMAKDGSTKPLIGMEFQTIDMARYSPDGRKLAVLERAAESAHLYIFDTDTRELLCDLTDMGIGDTVSAFTWDSMGSIVYSIGGSGSIQVHQYDFNVPSESKRHSIVDKKGADEVSIAYCSGEVYFAETLFDTGAVIYRIKPEGGLRKEFLRGSAFALSRNEKYMAYTQTSGDGTETAEQAFSYYNMTTGESTVITKDFAVYEFIWSWDGNRVFYIENKLSGGENEGTASDAQTTADGAATDGSAADASAADVQNDPYPYTLWEYDVRSGMNRQIIDLPYTSISVSNRADEVYLNYYDAETMGDVVRATYIIPLD